MKKAGAKSKAATPDTGRITIGELRRSNPVAARRLVSDGFREFSTRMELVSLMLGEENSFGESCEKLVKDRKGAILSKVAGDERSLWLWIIVLRLMEKNEGCQPSKFSVRAEAERELPDLFPEHRTARTWTEWWKKAQLQKLIDEGWGNTDKRLSSS